MKAVCAWCKAEMPLPKGDWKGQEGITHGICPGCAERQLFGIGGGFHHFLDSLPLPVFVLDGSTRIRSANRRACELVGKSLAEMEGIPCGDALVCGNARLPGGCDNAPDCSGCLIRRSILNTFETGQTLHRVPAPIRKCASTDPHPQTLLISTEKIGHAVLFRLDELQSEEAPR
ncbi:MAG: PAS domain-containing protein [Armatimonadetes bacterium]|nr:PAS domain-containing protein [Armatimonadota bacterium]